MKNLYLKYAVLGLTIASTIAHAQGNQTVAIARPSVTGSILGEAGDYKVQTYDRTVLDNVTLNVMKDRPEEDKQFVLDSVRKIELQVQDLNSEVNKVGGIVDLGNKNIGSTVQLIDYLAVTTALIAKINAVDAAINGIFAIPSAMKSQEKAVVEGQERTILPAPLKVELEKIEKWYNTQKEQNLALAKTLPITVVLPNGVPQQVAGFSYRPTQNIYSADVLNKMRLDAARDAMANNNETKNMVSELHKVALEEIRSSRKTFGTSQHYRFNTNKAGRDATLERIADIFQARNYLRAIYGQQVGVIGIDWEKLPANLDVIFTMNTTILGSFYPESIYKEREISEQQDKIANALFAAEKRNQEVFGEGTDILSRIMSGLTFITGYCQLASVNVFMLELLKADAEFEYIVSKPGGLKAVREAYRARYYKTAEMEARSKAIARTFNMKPQADADDAEQDVFAFSTDSNFRSALFTATMALEGVLTRAEQARSRILAIDALQSNSGELKRSNTRRDTL